MSKWGRLCTTACVLIALAVPGATMATAASATAAGPSWSNNTYTGKSTDHAAPTGGSVNPDTNLNRVSQSVLVKANFSPGNPAQTTNVTIKECNSTVSGCSTLTTLNIPSTLLLSTTVNVTDCGDAVGCTVFSYLTNDTDDTMTVPIKFAPPAQTSTTLQLSATGFTSGANLTVPYGTSVHAQATVTTPGYFSLIGNVQYSLFSDSSCTMPSGAGTSGPESTDTGVDAPSTQFLVPAPGTYYWKAAYLNNDANNLPSSTACGDNVLTVTPPLFTSVSALPAAPGYVTAGNDVQYTLSVQNQGPTTATGVHVLATLDSGVTPLSSSPSGACTLTTPVADCTIGNIGAGATATVALVVQAPNPAPASGKITLSATATPGTNNTASIDTAVQAPVPGQTSGFVPPGNSIDTGGNNPADLSLPNTGGGAPITITQANGAQFCNGPCNGPASSINNFTGYNDPTHPLVLVLTYTDSGRNPALQDFQHSTVYKHFDNDPPNVGHAIPDCADNPAWTSAQKQQAKVRRAQRDGTQSGIANPSPCVDQRTITALSSSTVGPYQVTFTILYLSDDGTYSRH
jgi:uncharacterized repeat protein (TIGR01451 family)